MENVYSKTQSTSRPFVTTLEWITTVSQLADIQKNLNCDNYNMPPLLWGVVGWLCVSIRVPKWTKWLMGT